MLTLPSEPLPQTALMEPLPSIPPSFVNYGLTASRRSPRKHHVTERRAPPKPYGKPTTVTAASQSRPRHATHTASHSVQSRLERTPPKETLTQERLDFSVSTKSICDTLSRPPISLSSTLLDRSHVTAPQSCSLLAPGDAPKGWVIGPLFQSFKSKMASFTEIVMSPFKSNSENGEGTTEGYVTAEEEAAATAAVANPAEICGSKVEGETDFDSDARVQSVVPLQTPETELESSVNQSAWNPTTTAVSTTTSTTAAAFCEVTETAAEKEEEGEEESASGDAKTRKRPNKAAPKANTRDTDCNVLTNTDLEMNGASHFVLKEEVGESQADQTPTSPSILEDASLQKVKRTLDLGGDVGKRKKPTGEQKRKPKRGEGQGGAEETLKTVKKEITRSNRKKCKMAPEEVVHNGSDAGNCRGAKAKAKIVKRAETKGDQGSDLPVNELKATQETKRIGQAEVASKKRKAKDDSNAKSDVSARDSEVLRVKEAAVVVVEERARAGRKQKKIKTENNGTMAEVELKLSRNATEKVYFEMAPFEGDVRQVLQPDEAASERGVTKRRTRRAVDPQRRRCRAVHGSKSPTKRRPEGALSPLSRDDSDAFRKGSATRLLRSVSCPEIPALRLHEAPWTPHFHSPPRSRSQPPQQQQQLAAPHSLSSSSLAHHFHRSPRRARRHTVCSVEVEREIAPLCLRKEVYPARRSPSPYDPQHLSSMRALSPGASLSALATCFLSSPLAFLSKKSEGGGRSGVSSPIHALSPTVRVLSPAVRVLSLSPSVHRSPCTAPSLTSLLGTSLGQLPGFHLRTDTLLSASSDATNSGAGVALLECTPDPTPATDEYEDTSSSSPESEELREETTHSDSELKTLKKDQGQRKVSSIKIRKALPKPQKNLTPMGLPKAVRVKKKEFSLEEIYTNKNFSKPPESRLETIFEFPLSRKNGSESWCGPRRLKRFLEFPELGEARRPRKPPAGAAKANASSSRPRRGSGREDPALAADPDSVLCAKLEQLELWLQRDLS